MPSIYLVAVMCLSLVGSVMGVFAFPSLLILFQQEWGLTNTEAGWINGIYFAGYTISVAWLSALADRIDAKRIFLLGSGILLLSNLAFALLAEGFWTALLFQGLAGVGLAAVYMPGLKALLDRYHGAKPPRVSAFYTASFGLGSALGYAVSGWSAARFGWPAAFFLSAGGAASAFLLALVFLEKRPPPPPQPGHLLDFRPVFKNREAMGYILAYGAHCWELFGQRGWMVAFLTHAAAQSAGSALGAPATIASLVSLSGMASSIIGGELAMKFGRRKLVLAALLGSGALALCIGFTADGSYALVASLCLLHGILILGDSAALTAGAVQAALPGRRGATMALHSVVGFAAAFFAPVAMGLAIDLGGGASPMGFGLGFAVLGLAAIPGALALVLLAGPGRAENS
ncbi:Permease of the major facilitator superfamily [Rhodospirillaceae bacterium LM-1]|nr:Permease of the major facilitator superfamily [Rhodospirillaceae bacterium LM-1]